MARKGLNGHPILTGTLTCTPHLPGSHGPTAIKSGFAMQCDKNDYRGVLAALEGVSGKKAVNSDAMTVKN
jgi:hypothetical protein